MTSGIELPPGSQKLKIKQPITSRCSYQKYWNLEFYFDDQDEVEMHGGLRNIPDASAGVAIGMVFRSLAD